MCVYVKYDKNIHECRDQVTEDEQYTQVGDYIFFDLIFKFLEQFLACSSCSIYTVRIDEW